MDKETLRRNLIMQVHAEGGDIEQMLRDNNDVIDGQVEEITEEEIDLIGLWMNKSSTEPWNWERFDYRIRQQKIEMHANIYSVGIGKFTAQIFNSEDQAMNSVIDGCYRQAVKLVEL